MLDFDKRDLPQRQKDQKEARDNKVKHANAALAAGDRVQADNFNGAQHADLGIHLFADALDDIEWYSDNGTPFTVNIHRDPEMILLDQAKAPSDPIDFQTNTGLDNLFQNKFPLVSKGGEAVVSGPIRNEKAIMDQRYYKYTVTSGNNTPLDPHIVGHTGF
jgi:hypothetical protein